MAGACALTETNIKKSIKIKKKTSKTADNAFMAQLKRLLRYSIDLKQQIFI